jgi:hypothetical protein
MGYSMERVARGLSIVESQALRSLTMYSSGLGPEARGKSRALRTRPSCICACWCRSWRWLSEYTTPMIYSSFLIEKNAKYSKKCSAISTFFLENSIFFISSNPELFWH